MWNWKIEPQQISQYYGKQTNAQVNKKDEPAWSIALKKKGGGAQGDAIDCGHKGNFILKVRFQLMKKKKL